MTLQSIDFTTHQVFDLYVTPDLAKSILEERNGSNRSIARKVVAKYADDMECDRWFDNEGNRLLQFYETGNLADGQHRLSAIIASDVSRIMRIEVGLPKHHAYGIDAHRMRKATDQIKIAGVSDWIGTRENAAVNFAMALNGSNKRPSTQKIIEICEKNHDRLKFVKDNFSKSAKFLTATPIMLSVACAYDYEDKDRLTEFCNVFLTGLPKNEGDFAAIRLRERIVQEGSGFQKNFSDRRDAFLLTQRAIKAFCGYQDIKKLIVPKSEIYKVFEV